MFQSTIATIVRLSDVEKLSYLQSCVKGAAADAMLGSLCMSPN